MPKLIQIYELSPSRGVALYRSKDKKEYEVWIKHPKYSEHYFWIVGRFNNLERASIAYETWMACLPLGDIPDHEKVKELYIKELEEEQKQKENTKVISFKALVSILSKLATNDNPLWIIYPLDEPKEGLGNSYLVIENGQFEGSLIYDHNNHWSSDIDVGWSGLMKHVSELADDNVYFKNVKHALKL